MRFGQLTITVSVMIFLTLSCHGNPSANVSPHPLAKTNSPDSVSDFLPGSTVPWGFWDIFIDPDTGSCEIIPVRSAEFTCNVTGYVDNSPANLSFDIIEIDFQPDGVDVEVEVGLRHPFPGLDEYIGFDVMGVFMGQGSASYPGNIDLAIPSKNDQMLLNPDGYTRWFNAPEFGDTFPYLFGWRPAKMGTPGFIPTANLNGYKYFADDLEPDASAFDFLIDNPGSRGAFTPGAFNHRIYNLRFPDSTELSFQYAVIAHWTEAESENVNGPDDFPMEANSAEALVFDLDNFSTVYYINEETQGGTVKIDFSVWDWSLNESGTQDEFEIRLFSDAWDGFVTAGPVVDEGKYYRTFQFMKAPEIIGPVDNLDVWLEINYPDSDYSNEFGAVNLADGNLAGYYRFKIPVLDEIIASIEIISPDGGEGWLSGTDEEITWISDNVPGTVEIEYSKHNFNADINLISSNEENDGSFMWEVPDDPSDTVRIRIKSTEYPEIFDVSDAVFTICSGIPDNVTSFSASDGDETLGLREIRLEWTEAEGCPEFYEIEKVCWVWNNGWSPPDLPDNYAGGSWQWRLVHSEPAPSTEWIDTDARFSSEDYPVEYRIRAINNAGPADSYTADTGFTTPKMVKYAIWCWAEDESGTNASTTWQRAYDEFTWCNDFWNKYGVAYELVNTDGFRWVTNPDYKNLTGNEPFLQHVNYGRIDPETDGAINVYYNDSWNGKTKGAWCWMQCVPEKQDTETVFCLTVGEPWDPPCAMLMPHELGHGVGRMYDQYKLDKNSDAIVEPGDTCLADQQAFACWGYDWMLFCDDEACYPQQGDPPVPKNLMWWGWLVPVDQYNLIDAQYAWVDAWLAAFGDNYPYP